MDTVIQNLHPTKYKEVLDDVLSTDNATSPGLVALSDNKRKADIEKFIRAKLNLTTNASKRTRKYWLLRGWSKDESFIKAKEHKQQNTKSVYSREFWLGKINPNTNKNYTINEADFERNSRRPIRKEYWIKKGYSTEDAINLAVEAKIKNNKKGAKKISRIRRS